MILVATVYEGDIVSFPNHIDTLDGSRNNHSVPSCCEPNPGMAFSFNLLFGYFGIAVFSNPKTLPALSTRRIVLSLA